MLNAFLLNNELTDLGMREIECTYLFVKYVDVLPICVKKKHVCILFIDIIKK